VTDPRAARSAAERHEADPAGWVAERVGPPGFTCPRCGRTSHHPDDIREGYCGACHDWTRDPLVCSACGTVSCWQGVLMCDEARTAGVRRVSGG
jgi:hypothetical protein